MNSPAVLAHNAAQAAPVAMRDAVTVAVGVKSPADAALLAAAPRLLAELRRLVAAIDRMPANAADGLADEARAVIAAAEVQA